MDSFKKMFGGTMGIVAAVVAVIILCCLCWFVLAVMGGAMEGLVPTPTPH